MAKLILVDYLKSKEGHKTDEGEGGGSESRRNSVGKYEQNTPHDILKE